MLGGFREDSERILKGCWQDSVRIKEGFWEKDIVMKAMRGVENYPTAVFLDIGANIGDIAGQVWSCFLT